MVCTGEVHREVHVEVVGFKAVGDVVSIGVDSGGSGEVAENIFFRRIIC